MIEKQMTIYDFLYPEKLDPIRELAMTAGAHWTDSKDRLIASAMLDDGDIKAFARFVRNQYCPYGCAGHYGGSGKPNTIHSWDMRTDRIEISWYDAGGELNTQWYSWEDFAREIYFIIMSDDLEKWRHQ